MTLYPFGEHAKVLMGHQPTYFPPLHVVHRMAMADIIVVSDGMQFSRDFGHQTAVLPYGTLTVPILRGSPGILRPFSTLKTAPLWTTEHLRRLAIWYLKAVPTHMARVRAVLENLDTCDYCTAINAIYMSLIWPLLPMKFGEVYWQSDLRVSSDLQGVDTILAHCQILGATHYILSKNALNSYFDHDAQQKFRDAGIALVVQDMMFPSYSAQPHEHWDWSILDLLLTAENPTEYLTMIVDQGWSLLHA